MLAQLFIRNIAVIEKASIDLEKGFTVLTGETGAGKSIIIDAIHAVLGERTSKELVRENSSYVNELAALDREKQEIRVAEDRIHASESSAAELENRVRVGDRRT